MKDSTKIALLNPYIERILASLLAAKLITKEEYTQISKDKSSLFEGQHFSITLFDDEDYFSYQFRLLLNIKAMSIAYSVRKKLTNGDTEDVFSYKFDNMDYDGRTPSLTRVLSRATADRLSEIVDDIHKIIQQIARTKRFNLSRLDLTMKPNILKRHRTLIQLLDTDGEQVGLFGTEIQEPHATNILNDIVAYVKKRDDEVDLHILFTEMKKHGYDRVFVEEFTIC